MGGFWSFLHYFVYFSILTSIFRKKEDWLNLINLAVFVGFLSALYGFGQKTDIKFFIGSGNRARIFGTIGNAALFSGYELMIVFLSLTLLFVKNNSWAKLWFYGTIFIVGSISILMTAVRGSVLGLAVGLFIFVLLYFLTFPSRKIRNILLSLIVTGVLFIFFALLFSDSSFIKNSRYLVRITDFSAKSYTVQTRFWAWEAGIKGWKEKFRMVIFGWGPENFNIPFSRYFNPNFYTGPGSETLFDRAHNMFVEVLVTMGIIGLISYISIFYFILRSIWQKLRETARGEFAQYFIGLISLTAAYMIHNFFFFDSSANFLLFFTTLGFIGFISYKLPEIIPSNKRPSDLQVLTVFLLSIAVIVLIYRTNVIPAKANYATTRAIIAGWTKDYEEAVDKFKESIAYDTFGIYEYRHRFAQLVFDNYSKFSDYRYVFDVIKEVEKNAESHPIDYLPHLYLSRLNILLGKDDPDSKYNDVALVHAEEALKLAPTFVRAYYETGQAYLNKQQSDKAIEEFKKAVELNPDVGTSYWYWGIVEAERGNLDEARIILEKALLSKYPYGPSTPDLVKAADLYVKSDNFELLAVIYGRLALSEARNPQYHATLAYVYFRLGRLDDAVKEAKVAVNLDSSYEAEAKAFVQSIGKEW